MTARSHFQWLHVVTQLALLALPLCGCGSAGAGGFRRDLPADPVDKGGHPSAAAGIWRHEGRGRFLCPRQDPDESQVPKVLVGDSLKYTEI